MADGQRSPQHCTVAATSHAQDLQAMVVADGDPIGLHSAPLDLVDLAFGGVRQNGIFDCSRHLLDVPDQRLEVIGGGADVTGGVRRPGEAVHRRAVVAEASDRRAGDSDVEDDDLRRQRAQKSSENSAQRQTRGSSLKKAAFTRSITNFYDFSFLYTPLTAP